uniref:(northern house mosquito) hypothetical protein n=2 Tax=Culex pipiens TaxID=7175 RepID=A0A8D8FK12_CULPI
MVSSRIFHQMEIPHCALWPSRVLQRTNTQSCGIAAAGYPLAQFGRRFGNAPPFPRVLETVPGAVRFTRNSLEKHDFSLPNVHRVLFFLLLRRRRRRYTAACSSRTPRLDTPSSLHAH